ncbi:hypothetical protein [Nocardia sp. NPDC051463]|uniref:hypothetical protein n=1 Tax=Nocardia sp. NPDC051463 TaxID=3154845 RepID=UPI003450F474
MTPEEIRAAYVETLARSRYERTRVAMNYPMNMPPWDDEPGEPYKQGGITVLQVGAFDPRRRHRVQAGIDADALAAAGLLPTGVEGRYIGRGLLRRTRFVGPWREPAESE